MPVKKLVLEMSKYQKHYQNNILDGDLLRLPNNRLAVIIVQIIKLEPEAFNEERTMYNGVPIYFMDIFADLGFVNREQAREECQQNNFLPLLENRSHMALILKEIDSKRIISYSVLSVNSLRFRVIREEIQKSLKKI